MFGVVNKLYGVSVEINDGIDTWHPDVRYYSLLDGDKQKIGGFYVDLFARTNKRSGAWMDECLSRMQFDEISQIPVAHLVCNFAPPTKTMPCLMTHNDVVTLFHEFGHTLHHLLTRVNYPSVAGINGVEWDAVELPSQFHENFAWQPATLKAISRHVTSGDTLPGEMIDQLLAARNFNSALFLLRQLEFALFDIELSSGNATGDALQTWRRLHQRIAVNSLPDYHRFPHSFSHIFSGGYAAGYYGYLWAEMLATDAYDKVVTAENPGAEALRFKSIVLERGGSQTAAALFHELMGREPDIVSFLRHHGIEGTTE